MVKEGESDLENEKDKEPELNEKQSKIKKDKEDRQIHKKGVDLAQLISRESPRSKPAKKKDKPKLPSKKVPDPKNVINIINKATGKTLEPSKTDEAIKSGRKGSQRKQEVRHSLSINIFKG